jgi:hypothetical protein
MRASYSLRGGTSPQALELFCSQMPLSDRIVLTTKSQGLFLGGIYQLKAF